MEDRLEKVLIKLYNNRNDRFYAHLFFQVDRVKDNNAVPTMGVGIKEGRIKLYYNTDFMDKLSDKQLIEILKHEALHLINEHILRGQGAKEKDALKHRMENIAQDCAINQWLDTKIIEKIGGVTLDRFRGMLTYLPKSFQIDANSTAEYYYDLLEQEKESREGQQGQQGLEGLESELEGMEMDSHDMFGEMDALDQAMLEDKIRKAAENAKADGAGRLPSEIEELLKIRKKPVISWQREIRQFIGQNARAEKRTTRSKRNRRYGIIQPGYKRDYTAKLLVVLDTSGSMYGERTEKVLSEIYGIYKATPNLQIDIVQCDADIQDVFTYDGKEEFKVSGRGGTEMTPALKYAFENKYDGAIFLTDGEFWNEDFESNNKIQTLWVIAQNSGYKSPIGRTVHI